MCRDSTLLAGASAAPLLLRVGLAGGGLQIHVHHVLLLRRQRLHSRQGRGDLAEQRLHIWETTDEVQCAQGTSKSLSICVVASLETNVVLRIWIWPWCWSRLSRWFRWTWRSILSPCSLLLLWTLVCAERSRMVTNLQAGVDHLYISLNNKPTQTEFKSIWSPLVNKISFVPNEHDYHIATSLGADFIDPLWGVQEGLSICRDQHFSDGTYSEKKTEQEPMFICMITEKELMSFPLH